MSSMTATGLNEPYGENSFVGYKQSLLTLSTAQASSRRKLLALVNCFRFGLAFSRQKSGSLRCIPLVINPGNCGMNGQRFVRDRGFIGRSRFHPL